jgi:hypothetical protein
VAPVPDPPSGLRRAPYGSRIKSGMTVWGFPVIPAGAPTSRHPGRSPQLSSSSRPERSGEPGSTSGPGARSAVGASPGPVWIPDQVRDDGSGGSPSSRPEPPTLPSSRPKRSGEPGSTSGPGARSAVGASPGPVWIPDQVRDDGPVIPAGAPNSRHPGRSPQLSRHPGRSEAESRDPPAAPAPDPPSGLRQAPCGSRIKSGMTVLGWGAGLRGWGAVREGVRVESGRTVLGVPPGTGLTGLAFRPGGRVRVEAQGPRSPRRLFRGAGFGHTAGPEPLRHRCHGRAVPAARTPPDRKPGRW